MQCNAAQHNATQHNAMQHNTTQHNGMQYNTMQYNANCCLVYFQFISIEHKTAKPKCGKDGQGGPFNLTLATEI
jgi:hypothetical protein